MSEPSRETLRREFAYDAERGGLVRIQREGDAIVIPARSSARPDGRVVHGVDGEMWLQSRLVWIWHHGPIGPNNVRHKLSRTDDRIGNLFLIPASGQPTLKQNRERAQAAWQQWRIYPNAFEEIASELCAGGWGSQEANQIALDLAADIRKHASGELRGFPAIVINEGFEALLATI